MTRFIRTIVVLLTIVHIPTVAVAQEETAVPELQAESAILMEAQSGQILYDKNAHQQMYPASITKILTAIIAIESGKMDEIVTVSQNAVNAGGTRVYLEEGEQKPLNDLVYGLMVNSGNDAAVAIAEHIGGSVAGFVRLMNEKARELGAVNSHFVNPSGMPDDDHVTTAHDMALISRYAMQNETFREIVKTKEYPWEGQGWEPGHITNHNRLLWDYDGTTGIKNGYTTKAQHTFVTSAERDGQQLIAVVLKVSGPVKNIYADLTALMDYGFTHFETHRLTLDGQPFEMTVDGSDVRGTTESKHFFVTLPKDEVPHVEQIPKFNESMSLPIKKDDVLGNVQLVVNGKDIQSIPIVATADVVKNTSYYPFNETLTSFHFPWITWVISIVIFATTFFYLRKVRRRAYESRRLKTTFKSYRSYRG